MIIDGRERRMAKIKRYLFEATRFAPHYESALQIHVGSATQARSCLHDGPTTTAHEVGSIDPVLSVSCWISPHRKGHQAGNIVNTVVQARLPAGFAGERERERAGRGGGGRGNKQVCIISCASISARTFFPLCVHVEVSISMSDISIAGVSKGRLSQRIKHTVVSIVWMRRRVRERVAVEQASEICFLCIKHQGL
jgi:hypothetical protein